MSTLTVRERDYELLLLTRAVLGGGTAQAGGLLRTAHPGAEGISAPGRVALERTLSTGLLRSLAQGGGARPERFGAAKPGRLWHRHPPPGLTITMLPVHLLQWLLAEPLAVSSRPPCPLPPASEPADLAIVYLAARLLVAQDLREVLAERVFRENPLVQLAFADVLAVARPPRPESRGEPQPAVPEFTLAFPALLSAHPLLVEAFCGWLAFDILAADRAPRSVAEAVLVSGGRRRTYAAWLEACGQVQRMDLALPLVDASVGAMARPAAPALSDEGASMRDRAAAGRAGTVLAEVVAALGAHLDALGSLEFFDDGYNDARALRARWAALDVARPVAEGRIRAVAGV